MQTQSLKQALAQTLETYQRMGLRRFCSQNHSQLPDRWLQTISTLDLAETCEEPQKHLPTPPTTTVQEPLRKHSSERSIGSAAGTDITMWQKPALSDPQRQSLFRELDSQIRNCRLCGELCGFRHQTVFGVGPLRPTLCFMGEAPGADEDRVGEPFVGRAGQLLTRIIGAMQLKREEVYILNALKCRPPGNRTPMPSEIGNCHPFVEEQLEILQPRFIVCLGAVAVRSLLGWETPIGRLRGKFYRYRGAQVVITYHPSYLLRNEQAKRLVWEDMQMLMKEMSIPLPRKS